MMFDTNLPQTSDYDDEDTFGKLKGARQGSHNHSLPRFTYP